VKGWVGIRADLSAVTKRKPPKIIFRHYQITERNGVGKNMWKGWDKNKGEWSERDKDMKCIIVQTNGDEGRSRAEGRREWKSIGNNDDEQEMERKHRSEMRRSYKYERDVGMAKISYYPPPPSKKMLRVT
jgi:hypothetical protein